MKTTLEEERAEQRRWKPRPAAAGSVAFFDRLLENEFAAPEVLERQTRAALEQVVRFAAARVPYYQRLFEARRVRPDTVRTAYELARLPLLTRSDLLEAGEELCARELPAGEQPYGWFTSSGTGRPVRVLQTATANLMFSCLAQRQYRWFRFDPARTFATIRLPGHMPPDAAGNPLPDGAMLRQDRWRYAGAFFATGPQLYFNVTNPVERQLAWLTSQRPDYLQSNSASLLVLACDGSWPAPGIRKCMAISEQVTRSLRQRIESATGVPLEQGYELNEIGLVATRCSGNRYHVHVEHCMVEIIDDSGAPCPPGRSGRLVVTALRNPAMPLLRYETGDRAEAVAGPCSCGRTLPAFGEIA